VAVEYALSSFKHHHRLSWRKLRELRHSSTALTLKYYKTVIQSTDLCGNIAEGSRNALLVNGYQLEGWKVCSHRHVI
jgi:hypothetical protein